MLTRYATAFAAALLATTLGCSANSQKQLLQSGQQPLDAESLYTLVAGKSMHLAAIDFDAQVVFRENQKLQAITRSGEKDTGSWDITSDNLLCLDFSKWYFSDLKCYAVFADTAASSYLFFTENGARYYTGQVQTTIPEMLQTMNTGKTRTSYLQARKKNSAGEPESQQLVPEPEPRTPPPAPEPSEAEMKRLVSTTARNCPSCNLSGADLSGADLVGANLSGANLAGANLRGANLRRADLSGADLHEAVLRAANLPGANLSGSNLTQADFSGANLIKANLTGAATKGAIFKDALLEGTTGIK